METYIDGHNLVLLKHGGRARWVWQFGEIAKLPACVGVNTPGDMLRTYGHIIPGMNQPQLYMKVHGCKTTGHQENCNFCSININVGPGDCEWFVVDAAHWNTVSLLCTRCVGRTCP